MKRLFSIPFLFIFVWGAPRSFAGSKLALRFDPGYLYENLYPYPSGKNSAKLKDIKIEIRESVRYWKENKVDRIFILLNNPNYGAFFKTKIPDQPQESNIGRTMLMKDLIQTLRHEHIEVFAWFFPFRSQQAWERRESWRAPRCDLSKNQYLLDVSNSEVQSWYRSLIFETLKTFPQLNGIDIAEPISVQDCAPSDFSRTERLTHFLSSLSKQMKRLKKQITLTPTLTASKSGHLWSFSEIKNHFGVDLSSILRTSHWSTLYPQLNYQEWDQLYHRPQIFNSNWPKMAYLELKKTLMQERIKMTIGAHLELGRVRSIDLATSELTFEKQLKGDASFWGFDIYDSHQARKKKIHLRSGLPKNFTQPK